MKPPILSALFESLIWVVILIAALIALIALITRRARP